MSTAHKHGQAVTRVFIEIEVIDRNNHEPLWTVTVKLGTGGCKFAESFTEVLPDDVVGYGQALVDIIDAAAEGKLPAWLQP